MTAGQDRLFTRCAHFQFAHAVTQGGQKGLGRKQKHGMPKHAVLLE